MTYDLVIGDRAYSSWSLRGWLLFDAFGIPVKTHLARLYTDELPNMLRDFFPANTAPTMRTPDGIGGARNHRHRRGTGHPPPRGRALARRPQGPRHRPRAGRRDARRLHRAAQPLPDEPARQLHRLRSRPRRCWPTSPAWKPSGPGRARPTGSTPPGSAAPIPPPMPSSPRSPPASPPTTCRSRPDAMLYVKAHLAHPSFRRWRAMGMVDGADQDFYRRDYPRRDWPGPVRLPATRSGRHRGRKRRLPLFRQARHPCAGT